MSNLVLTRHRGEAIRIGDEIVVTVVSAHDGKVRLAVEAPRIVPIHRQEVWDAIQREKREEE